MMIINGLGDDLPTNTSPIFCALGLWDGGYGGCGVGGWKHLSNIVKPIMLGSFVYHYFSTSTSLEDRLDRYKYGINEC
jgi:hypothetical protein